MPHVREPVRCPLDGVDGVGPEAVGRLLEQAGGAREGELGDDLGGQRPEGVVRIDAAAGPGLAAAGQAQDLLLHDLVLVVDQALELEGSRAGEHVVHHPAPLAVELRVDLPEYGLVGVEGIVEDGVFDVLGVLAVDDLVQADVVEMELVWSDAEGACVCQGVSTFCNIPKYGTCWFFLLYSLCSLSNTLSGYLPFSVAILNSQSLEIAASRGPGKPARGWKCTR